MLKENLFTFTLKKIVLSWCGNSYLEDHNIVFNIFLYSFHNYITWGFIQANPIYRDLILKVVDFEIFQISILIFSEKDTPTLDMFPNCLKINITQF